jgi:hypothetical protein
MNARGLQTDVRGLRDRCEGLADGCNDVLHLFLFRVILFNLLDFCVALLLDLIFIVNFLSRTFVRILLCSSKIPSSTYLLDVLLRSLVERDNSECGTSAAMHLEDALVIFMHLMAVMQHGDDDMGTTEDFNTNQASIDASEKVVPDVVISLRRSR